MSVRYNFFRTRGKNPFVFTFRPPLRHRFRAGKSPTRYPKQNKKSILIFSEFLLTFASRYSEWVLSVSENIFYLCGVGAKPPPIHIVKVFFASPLLKMWKFSCTKDETDNTHSCVVMQSGVLSAPIYHIYPSVRCRSLSRTGSFHNLQ